ncbi:MAG: hypothetical protein ABIK09_19620 [Pseudomonadota bacterium]
MKTSLVLTALLCAVSIFFALAGCSPAPTGPISSDIPVGDAAADGGEPDVIVGVPDAAPDAAEETAVEVFDDGTPDAGPACAPGEGCFLDPCSGNDECQSGWCVAHMGEGVCTIPCQEDCPTGWECRQVAGTDPDVVYICVSDHANLCRPCASAEGCKSVGGAEDACLSYGVEGSFCGSPCGDDEGCPWGFSCTEVETVDGVALAQCVADAGICPCTATSVALGLFTPCAVTSEWGTCPGKRVCTDDGLTDCDAPAPGEEVCDGLDNDCDGDVDEETCDDGNPCTGDACLGADGCEHVALEGGECLDGNPCTVADHCEAGVCVGDPVLCDDENPCTDNLCAENGGCVYPPNSGTCDDGDPCTLGDACADGACHGIALPCDCVEDGDCAALDDGDACNGVLVCDTGSVPFQCEVAPESVVVCPQPEGVDAPCLAAACAPDDGSCALVSAGDGQPCEDGSACSLGDLCQQGACVGGAPANCNDGNPCTDDACDPALGCTHASNQAPCTDDDVCTVGDLCAADQCQPGAGAPDCDDGNPCTGDICDSALGCTHAPTPGPCSDGNPCTTGDSCMAGTCVGGASTTCNDGNPCTNDACDLATGCVFTLNTAPCNDDDVCTTGDFCHLGECDHAANLVCDDGNACTDDSCHPVNGCVHSPNQAPCDDGNACTAGDKCSDGWCLGPGPVDCDDGDLCTDDACAPAQGCVHVHNAAPCDDGDACTLGDVCAVGTCAGGGLLDCGDGSPCTDDACDPLSGCTHTPNQAPCTDADACTNGDQCAGGLCVPGPGLGCDDGDVCTDDSCDPADGCHHVDNQAPCDDDDACTVTDVCADGACVGTGALACDNGDHCTTDSCDPATGCIHVDITPCCGNGVKEAGEACDDGNLTPGDGCEADCTLPAACEWAGVPQLYCNGGCTWSGGSGCDQTEADIYCKLTTCNCNAHAVSFQVVTALPQPGFGCTWGPGDDFGEYPQYCVNMNVVYSSGNVLAENGPGSVIANVQCSIP